jgi:hypothetical protein
LVEVTTGATYTANYTCTEKQKYKITWKNYDEGIIYTENLEYGTLPDYDEDTY